MTTATKDKEQITNVTISPPKFELVTFTLRGSAPYVSNNFSEKARAEMRQKQEAGSTAKSKKTREAKDFQLRARGSMHLAHEGWIGAPATAFRGGLISACRLVGFKMTMAKLSLSIMADGYDKVDGTPLVRFTKGEPHYCEHYVRLATGAADLCPRMMWDPGWEMALRVRWDADQFTVQDVTNLLSRVGTQVGIGAGRPDSKESCGMGWGLFDIVN